MEQAELHQLSPEQTIDDALRIAVMGDFHIKADQPEMSHQAVDDVSACDIDLLVPLGDYGQSKTIGKVDGLVEVYSLFAKTQAQLRPLIGNHDLQDENRGRQVKGTMEKAFTKLFALDKSFGVSEYSEFRLFFVSNELQPVNSCYQVQEVYVSDAQFNLIVEKLRTRPGVPAIFFSHAPPIGCGLRTVPAVHVRGTNAYLDQNHDPLRWLKLVKDYPEIVLWFSAHYHLGHQYADTMTNSYGTWFFNTGVHAATRDGLRQSRVIDITSHGIAISTLDHAKRQRLSAPDWEHHGPLHVLVDQKAAHKEPLRLRSQPASDGRLACFSACSVGNKPAIPGGLVSLGSGRYLLAAQDGFAWEVFPEKKAVLGTIALQDEPLDLIAASADGLWFVNGRSLNWKDRRSPFRFVRKADSDRPGLTHSFDCPIDSICGSPDGGLLLVSGKRLWQARCMLESQEIVVSQLLSIETSIVRIICEKSGVWLQTDGNALWHWNAAKSPELVSRAVVCFDCFGSDRVGLYREQDRLTLTYTGQTANWELPFLPPDYADDSELQCLGQGRVLLRAKGTAWWYAGAGSELLPIAAGAPVMAIERAAPPEGWDATAVAGWFCLALAESGPGEQPKLQVWGWEKD